MLVLYMMLLLLYNINNFALRVGRRFALTYYFSFFLSREMLNVSITMISLKRSNHHIRKTILLLTCESS